MAIQLLYLILAFIRLPGVNFGSHSETNFMKIWVLRKSQEELIRIKFLVIVTAHNDALRIYYQVIALGNGF